MKSSDQREIGQTPDAHTAVALCPAHAAQFLRHESRKSPKWPSPRLTQVCNTFAPSLCRPSGADRRRVRYPGLRHAFRVACPGLRPPAPCGADWRRVRYPGLRHAFRVAGPGLRPPAPCGAPDMTLRALGARASLAAFLWCRRPCLRANDGKRDYRAGLKKGLKRVQELAGIKALPHSIVTFCGWTELSLRNAASREII